MFRCGKLKPYSILIFSSHKQPVQEGVDQVVQIVESMHKNFRNHFKEKMEKYDEIHKKIKGLNDDKQRLE